MNDDFFMSLADENNCDVNGCIMTWRYETPSGRRLCARHYEYWNGGI